MRVIVSYFRKRKILRAALIKRMKKHEGKIVKMQAVMRGFIIRVRHAAVIKKIKIEAPKKTKKYQQISKLQANIKGFLFRQRRMRALAKLGNKEKKPDNLKDSILDDDLDEFDADKFFGIKEENFESGLSLPQE